MVVCDPKPVGRPGGDSGPAVEYPALAPSARSRLSLSESALSRPEKSLHRSRHFLRERIPGAAVFADAARLRGAPLDRRRRPALSEPDEDRDQFPGF